MTTHDSGPDRLTDLSDVPTTRMATVGTRPATTTSLRTAGAAELIKLTTLRSTWTTLVAGFVVIVGLGLVISLRTAAEWAALPVDERAAVDAVEDALLGGYLAQIAFGAFGVVAATSDFVTGTITPTLIAVTRRWRTLVAKALVVAGAVAGVATVSVLSALALASAVLPGDVPLMLDAVTVRVVLGNVLSMTAIAVVGMCLGVLTRSTVAALGVLLATMVLPAIVVFAPEMTTYFPARVAQAVLLREASPESHLLSPGPAAILLIGYVVALFAVALELFRRRDVG